MQRWVMIDQWPNNCAVQRLKDSVREGVIMGRSDTPQPKTCNAKRPAVTQQVSCAKTLLALLPHWLPLARSSGRLRPCWLPFHSASLCVRHGVLLCAHSV